MRENVRLIEFLKQQRQWIVIILILLLAYLFIEWILFLQAEDAESWQLVQEEIRLLIENDAGPLEAIVPRIININEADEKMLTNLPGIGPAKAKAIITYRNENGFFEAETDLLQVTGIGEKTFEQLKERITVGGE